MLKFQNKTDISYRKWYWDWAGYYKEICGKRCKCHNPRKKKGAIRRNRKNARRKLSKKNKANATIKIFDGVDVSDEKDVTGMFDALKSENVSLDVVVNNAGVSGPVTCFAHAPLDQFRSTVDIHLTGTFWTSVQALKCYERGSKNYYNFNIFC